MTFNTTLTYKISQIKFVQKSLKEREKISTPQQYQISMNLTINTKTILCILNYK